MQTNEHPDFLSPGIRQVRKSIRDIDDSYNNEWDILAELCQNSVDAIRATERRSGAINIFVDASTSTIQVEDDGVGIDPAQLKVLLKPFSTNKDSDESAIGEKGVGLTFAMFSCNDFQIRTGTLIGAAMGRVVDARSWKTRTDDMLLPLVITPLEEHQGTTVILKGIDPESALFNWTREQLIFVLRTRTAIGSTESIWGEAPDIRVVLTHRSKDGDTSEPIRVPFSYWLPNEGLTPDKTVDLDEFIEWARDVNRSDQDKRRKLQDRVIAYRKDFTHTDNRTIRAYACYVPSRQAWKELSQRAGLATEEQLEDQEWSDNFSYTQFTNGIFTSVKGMPTGVEVLHPTTGYSGYWSNFFMMFEDKRLRFDIGRKSIHGMQAKIYRNYARTIFNEFLRIVTRYVSGQLDADTASWDRDAAFDAIAAIPDLSLPGYSLQKSPKDQEAGVAAVFFEAIGKGAISGITPLVTGYRNKYDLYAKLGSRRVVIEFKNRLSALLRDFNDERKMFDEIDAVVAWDVSEDDVEKFQKRGLQVAEITQGLSGVGPQFPHATHELRLPNVNPIYVIDLKRVLTRVGS